MTKVCEWCNKEFEGTKASRFCKDDHYKECENCGASFFIKDASRPRKACSKKCSDALTVKSNMATKTCQLCEKDFETINKRAKFCPDDHYTDCIICSKEFKVVNPHKMSKTCSKKCAGKTVDFDRRNEKSKKTIQAKYGVDNISQLDDIKDKKEDTLMKNYGVKNPSNSEEVKKKREKTNLSNYGVKNAAQNSGIQEKMKQTNMKRYGVENVFAHKETQERIKQTNLKKYGVENISLLESTKSQVRKTTLEKFGVESVLALPENQLKSTKTNKKRISKVNKKWQETIEKKLGIHFEFEQKIGNEGYADLGYQNILIDINPTVTHNSTISYAHFFKYCTEENCEKKSHKPTDRKYHQKRALEAEKNGQILLQYFDWFDEEIFLSILQSKLKQSENKVFAKKTELREIKQSEANRFFEKNHLMGKSNGQTLCIGLFYDDELIHCQSYGKARMSKKADWEAIRSCTKIDYIVPGAFSKCDKYFFNKINPDSVVSYVDLSISQGEVDTMFDGWAVDTINQPGAVWVKMLSKSDSQPLFIKDSTARRVSADRLLGYEVGEKYPREDENGHKITNDFVLISEGYVKVYDAGTKTVLWHK